MSVINSFYNEVILEIPQPSEQRQLIRISESQKRVLYTFYRNAPTYNPAICNIHTAWSFITCFSFECGH